MEGERVVAELRRSKIKLPPLFWRGSDEIIMGIALLFFWSSDPF
jgi:hypothetical protein